MDYNSFIFHPENTNLIYQSLRESLLLFDRREVFILIRGDPLDFDYEEFLFDEYNEVQADVCDENAGLCFDLSSREVLETRHMMASGIFYKFERTMRIYNGDSKVYEAFSIISCPSDSALFVIACLQERSFNMIVFFSKPSYAWIDYICYLLKNRLYLVLLDQYKYVLNNFPLSVWFNAPDWDSNTNCLFISKSEHLLSQLINNFSINQKINKNTMKSVNLRSALLAVGSPSTRRKEMKECKVDGKKYIKYRIRNNIAVVNYENRWFFYSPNEAVAPQFK